MTIGLARRHARAAPPRHAKRADHRAGLLCRVEAALRVAQLGDVRHWSSSENGQTTAWCQRFDDGTAAPVYKLFAAHVRPVRAFTQ